MSISQNFPNTRPSLNLNFARSQTLDPRITFTRTTIGTRVGPDGLIEVIPADQPRFDHDPTTGESLGLLVEEQRTNEFPHNTNIPGSFTGSATRTGVTILTPDGDANGHAMLTDASAFGTNYENFATSGSDNEVAGTVSFYAKKKTAGTGTLTVTMEGGGVSRGFKSGAINSDTWTRVTATKDYTGSTSLSRRYDIYLQSGNSSDGDTEFYICFLQFENGSFPTSYIPTEGSTKTRNPDDAYIEGTQFNEFYNSSEGTVFCSFSSPTPYGRVNASPFVFSINRNTIGWGHYVSSGGSSISLFRDPSNVNIAALDTAGSPTIGITDQERKLSVGYKLDDFVQYVNIGNGVISERTDPSGQVRTDINAFAFNPSHSGLRRFGGHIQKFVYYPTKFTNTQIRNLAL